MANPSEEEIMALIAERESMRQARRFSDADATRENLRKMGVELYDKERQWKCKDGRSGEMFTAGGGACLLTDANIHELIQMRGDAQRGKDWDKADTIRVTLRSQGVELDDRARQWRAAGGRSGTYSGESRSSAALLSDAEIKALVAERERARDAKDFQSADELRRRLLRLGVELFDNERTWKTNDGRQGVIITGGSGSDILGCSLTDAEIMMHIQRREDARTQKDFSTADLLREELRNSGVELIDAEQKWRATDGRMGSFPGAALQQQASLLGVLGSLGGVPAASPAQQALQAIQQLLGAGAPSGACGARGSAGGLLLAAEPDAKKRKLSDASIEALISGREVVRAEAARAGSGNLDAARAIEEDLRSHGVEVHDHHLMWMASDGRQGNITPAPEAAAASAAFGAGGMAFPGAGGMAFGGFAGLGSLGLPGMMQPSPLLGVPGVAPQMTPDLAAMLAGAGFGGMMGL